ncbi:protein piccolo-like [Astyanax mexicanus]|uniref:Protein piccolo-like n=1 Tax=Astyanax mexicanus TaxID=7994 RepID=A0A8T2LLL8_ASTMX|nr:protein piccolo-like [Astyanax mexicanus]
MQRALGGAEPPGPPMMKPPSQPSKAPTPSQPPGKQSPSPAQKKDPPQNKGLPPSANQQTKPTEGQKPPDKISSAAAKQATGAPATPPLQQKPSQQQTAKTNPSPAKPDPSLKAEPHEEQSGFFGFGFGGARSRSPSPQPSASAVSGKGAKQTNHQKPPDQQTAKAVPPPAKSEPSSKEKPPQEESSLFGFGFGGARSRSPSPQPAASAVSGKVLGFGSSLFSSASNLISSAVQDEPSTTPPTSRKGSSTSHKPETAAPTPATFQKGTEASQDVKRIPHANQSKPNVDQQTEEKKVQEPQPTKTPLPQAKKLPNSCPLCKTDIKKDPPNYNTCTECKSIVCNLCGFNPVPHQTESSFLSSASNLISTAVQDEPSKTPPTSRKGSSVSQASVKSPTPPASRKASSVSQTSEKTPSVSKEPLKSSAKNVPTPPASRKGSVAQKQEEKKVPEEQAVKAPVSVEKKGEPLKEPLGNCPLCKVELKKDPPNYNTCTECKNTVCNLCGFIPVPQDTEVRECVTQNMLFLQFCIDFPV